MTSDSCSKSKPHLAGENLVNVAYVSVSAAIKGA